jgi:protein phosphatase
MLDHSLPEPEDEVDATVVEAHSATDPTPPTPAAVPAAGDEDRDALDASATIDALPPDIVMEREAAGIFDIDAAVGAPESTADACAPAFPADGRDELEELTLPSTIPALDPLAPGTLVGPDGTFRIEEFERRSGQVNLYRVADLTSEHGDRSLELHEGPIAQSGLIRTAEVLETVRYAMLPTLVATWESDERRYLVLTTSHAPTLAEALATGMRPEGVVSVVLQLAQAIRRLHESGWAITSLTPASVRMSQPVLITQISTCQRVGTQPDSARIIAGYSAPELAYQEPITGREDVYGLGAILYHGLSGAPILEEGTDIASLAATLRVPGAPQLLAQALAPADERMDIEAFYHGLLGLKKRLGSKPIGLHVATGTTLGLNRTRTVNEDACGYLTWTSAWEGRVVQHAVLCAIDGMGGMEAGEVASTSALRAVLALAASSAATQISQAPGPDGQDEASPPASIDPAELVQHAAATAHAAAGGRQVGATITCAVVDDGRLRLAHVGDTRGYLLRQGRFVRLTRDHSLVAAMVASGMLTDDEARDHPESNKVLRSLGGLRQLPEGYIDDLSAGWESDVLDLEPDDQIILCSDGVWGVIVDEDLRRILLDSPDSEHAVTTILQQVLAGGAPDNAAVVIARCVTIPAA